MKINELFEDITNDQLKRVEIFADKLWGQYGVDIKFTHHFLDRINDPRNKTQISLEELVYMFKKEYEQYGKAIAGLNPRSEAVMKDLFSNLNLPFVINKTSDGKQLVAKTIMRKPNFKTPNQEYVVK